MINSGKEKFQISIFKEKTRKCLTLLVKNPVLIVREEVLNLIDETNKDDHQLNFKNASNT